MDKTTKKRDPKVYVGTCAKDINGSIRQSGGTNFKEWKGFSGDPSQGGWLNLNDYRDIEEFEKACKKLHEDEANPEFLFLDYKCIPDSLIRNDHSIYADLWNYLDINKEFKNSYLTFDLDAEIIAAGIHLNIPPDLLEKSFKGEYRDDEEFAMGVESSGLEDRFGDRGYPWRIVRDLMQNYVDWNGFYFLSP